MPFALVYDILRDYELQIELSPLAAERCKSGGGACQDTPYMGAPIVEIATSRRPDNFDELYNDFIKSGRHGSPDWRPLFKPRDLT